MDAAGGLLLTLGLGVGLSAACGFRVFVPLFLVGVAARAGHIELPTSFGWVEGNFALSCLGAATLCEVLAYYVPWFDNLLDTVATPAAAVAGTVMMMGMAGEMSPALKWALGIIAGGGSATLVQMGTVALRGASSLSTGGLGNSLVATGETAASLGMVLLAVLAPVLAMIAAVVVFVLAICFLRKLVVRRAQYPSAGV